MSKLLLVAPEHVGIIDVVYEGLKEYSGYGVDLLDLNPERFRYKHFGQRVYNFLLKTFLGQNLKTRYYEKIFTEKIAALDAQYECILIIRPDILTDRILNELRKRTNRFIAYYWDTVSFFPRKLKITHYFNTIYSFDPVDCREHGFHFLSNFYFYEKPAGDIAYQVYNISTYDHRSSFIEAIAKKLEEMNISFCLKAVHDESFTKAYIQYEPKVIGYREMLKEIEKTAVLLEVQKKEQRGLTFRPFEALGLNKKLITTNPEIRNYDFYDETNILILDQDKMNIDLPRAFFETAYRPIPAEKREKYHLKNWIKTMLSS